MSDKTCIIVIVKGASPETKKAARFQRAAERRQADAVSERHLVLPGQAVHQLARRSVERLACVKASPGAR